MNYALAIAVYMVLYAMLVAFSLMRGAGESLALVAAFSVPVLLVMPRVLQRFAGGEPLLPQPFREERRLPYAAGWILVFLGHLAFTERPAPPRPIVVVTYSRSGRQYGKVLKL